VCFAARDRQRQSRVNSYSHGETAPLSSRLVFKKYPALPKVLHGLKFQSFPAMRHNLEVAMKKPVILSLGAMACALLVFAVPSYNNPHREKVAQSTPGDTDPVTGKQWLCETESGPDAPNLIVLQKNGSFLKLIDYSEVSGNGTNYDLQGEFDIKQDQLLARISKPSGEVYTDVYTVKQMDDGNMQMTRTVNNTDNADTENTSYNCSMLASGS
jgi:hypothetical protein